MTQPPPQPPNEPEQPAQPPQVPLDKKPEPQDTPPAPPAGGFGAPTEPPAGGFGAPTPPPPQGAPGYGYPQAPQGAPQPPQGAPQTPPPPAAPPQGGAPGYGYPGQQAPAFGQPAQPAPPTPAYGQPQYGQQQQPYGQQQYGYPQPATTPMQPATTGGPGGGKGSPIVWIITAAVAVIALIVGGGIIYANSGDDGGKDDTASSGGGKDTSGKGGAGGGGGFGGAGEEKVPSNTSAKVAFQLPAPAVAKDNVDSVMGSWLTDKVYAKAGVNEITGYDPASGTKKWTLPLSGQTCGFTPTVTKDALAAVVAEDGKRDKKGMHKTCSQITLFNVNTGEKAWTTSIGTGEQAVRFEELNFTGDTLAAGGGLGGGAAFDIKTGKTLWKPQQGTCEDVGYAGGAQLVAVRKCGDYGDEKYQVQLLDPRSGQPKWSYKLASGVDNAKILSTDPVVIGVGAGDNSAGTVSDIFSMDANGKLITKISIDDQKYDFDCEVGKIDGCKKIVVGNGRVYLATRQHDGGSGVSGQTNEIVSYDLKTGNTTSDRADGGEYEIFPFRMDGGNILAYKGGPYDKGSQVVTIDPKSMKQTTLLELPATQPVQNAVSSMVPGNSSSELLYSNGRLYFGKGLISPPYSKDDKQFTGMGFVANG
jgi:nitrite reductase/ring-hydroxylating ferredoxin subunit